MADRTFPAHVASVASPVSRSAVVVCATVLWLVAGCASTPAPVPEAPPATLETEPERSANEEMQYHFWDIAEARDAVINADVAGIKPPLLRIAEAQYGDDMPLDWRSWIGEMQAQARVGSRASTLAEAARAVANLSGTCAECHRATGAGPSLTDEEVLYQPLGAGLSERMRRHMWAAEALWAGLTAPQHQAWSRGARALSELSLPEEPAGGDAATDSAKPEATAPMTASPAESTAAAPEAVGTEPAQAASEPAQAGQQTESPPAVSPFVAKLDAIRRLGQRADAAAQPSDKAAVYGEILAQCADCHAEVRGR